MTLPRTLASRLSALFRQRAAEEDLEKELQSHLQLLTERYIHQGMNAGDARNAAARQFGAATQLKETLREQRGVLFFENVLQDTRYALRQLRKSRAFSLTAILTLALGIGINTAVFSIVYAVLLRPLPFKDAGRLTMIWEQNPHRGWYHNIVSAANFKDWRKQNHVFADIALIDPYQSFNLTGGGEPVEVKAEQVTPNLFSVLGVQPFLGRSFRIEEGRPGSPRVVVLGHAVWRRHYGGDPAIIGKQISLNSESYTVIGIMPSSFSDVYSRSLSTNAQLWVSGLDLTDTGAPYHSPDLSETGRTYHNFISIARLRPGVTLQQARAEMTAIAAAIERQYPESKGWGVGLVSMHDEVVGNARPALLVLLVAVAVVLLIACVNLANLLLARGAVRLRELAVRKALGANRRRLITQLLTESLLMSAGGALAGLALAAFGTRGLIAIAPFDTPGIESAGLNTVVLFYTAGIAFLTAIVFGLLPALGFSNVDLSASLKESGRATTEGSTAGKIRKLLVSAEFALALILVVCAGLMIKTLMYMHRIELGFRPEHVLSLRIPLNDVKYNEQQQSNFYRALLARLNAIPGIQAAAISHGIPVFGWVGQGFVTDVNSHPAPADIPNANYVPVAPHYFDVLRIPLINGRVFTDRDTPKSLRVAVVNEVLARKGWPGQSPIGRQIKLMWNNAQWLTVVGVTGNVRTQGPESNFLPEIYVPYTQHPWLLTPRNLLVRTRSNPLSVLPSIRQAVRELDPDQPIADVRTLENVVAQPLGLRNFLTCLLGGFALLALVLAAIGVYGVMAYSVAQRVREIGIRIALGATYRQVLGIVLGDGMRLCVWGILLGLIGSYSATRLLASQLCGVKPTDPSIFAAVAFLLALTAVIAAYVPARRAARIDPIAVLRDE